jgi:hypothetical protein
LICYHNNKQILFLQNLFPFYYPNHVKFGHIVNLQMKGANMATNPPYGDGHRNGAVKDRFQTYNPHTGHWTKHDASTGRFMDQKADNGPFKGVTKKK